MILRVKLAQYGDSKAFISLMEENKMAMERIAYGFFQNEEDVADVIQSTILDTFEHLSELKNARYFKTWLMRILINNCNKLYNENKKTVSVEEIPETGIWEDSFSDEEFKEIIKNLPKDSRLIFQLYYGEEFTIKEISKILELKENTVKSKLHRGKEQIKKEVCANGKERVSIH